ncbi:MAG: efflux RND transporter periplasmic adaptor subunit [Bacteroidetes bacterium]|nr:efflux RND transporter periplasmic adaptor subunit [Bacteroidota bacterium]
MKKAVSIILFGIIIFALSACGNGNDANVIEESGTIEVTNVVLSSLSTGKVKLILKEEGSWVKEGDTLIVIDHEALSIQLKQVHAQKAAANAQLGLIKKGARIEDIRQAAEMLKQAQINYEQSQKDKERFEKLFESNAVTQKQLDDVSAKYNVALAQYNSAKENLKKIKNIARPEEIEQVQANYDAVCAQIEMIQKNIRDSYIVSPIDGFLLKVFPERGETVTYLSSLVKVSDLSNVELSVFISEKQIPKIKLGQTAKISIDAFENKTYDGRVSFISSEAEFTPKNIQTKDERTKLVFKVKISIPNPDFELKAGLPADAVINLNDE